MIKKREKLIPINSPSITDLEIEMIVDAARNSGYQGFNKYIDRFEKEFAEYIGVKYAMVTSSCHGALHMGLAALGIGPGDEVIVPDITWIASAAVVTYVGATPIFIDIDPETWCIDPKKIEKAITLKTKAIMAVTMYGHPPEMDEILKIAKKHKLFVVEDAAQAVGSIYHEKRPGSMGDFGGFSFHGSKLMSTGEGGMFTTNNKDLYDKVIHISNLGKDPQKLFWNTSIGLKYKMSNIQAAMGVAQLQRINEILDKKREIFSWYKKELEKILGITLNTERLDCVNTYWMPTIIWDKKFGIEKEEMVKKLKEYNVIARPFFYPLSSMPPFEKCKADNPVAYSISPYSINLPSYHDISKEDVKYICDCIKEILKK